MSTALDPKLDELFDLLLKIRHESPEAEFDRFGKLFDENCTVWLQSMREHLEPSIGRQAVIKTLKDNLTHYYLEERRILSQAVDEANSRVFCEMKNRLVVHGEVLDPFYETAIATFNADGLITDFKFYSCRSHIVMLIQKATGIGPYADVWQHYHCIPATYTNLCISDSSFVVTNREGKPYPENILTWCLSLHLHANGNSEPYQRDFIARLEG